MESQFEGEGLTNYATNIVHIRRFPGETDWEYRKRIFVNTFARDSLPALEMLFGCKFVDFTDHDRAILAQLKISRSSCVLSRFVGSIEEDPILKRKVTAS